MRGEIERILSVTKKEKGYVTVALVDGEEVSGWSAEKDEYKVGDPITYYFDDKYGKPKFNKAVDK